MALDCRDAIYQLKAQEADLWNQRFDVKQTDFENQIAQIQHVYDVLDSYVENAENTGRISTNALRLKQIAQEQAKVKKLQAEYKGLQAEMTSALKSGEIKKNTEGYYEMLSTLNDIREEIADTTANISELNKSIRETNWEIFDKALERIESLNDELEFLYGLLGDEEKFFDNKGIVNNEGITAFGVLSAQYNVSMQEAQKYANEIKKINKEIAKDPYNQDLIDRRIELNEAQRDAIESAEKYKDSIVDLVETGIKAQINSLKELIETYEDLLDKEKDEADYAKKISSAQDNINSIQKQLNAYANDDTEEGATRRQKLRNDLKNAQDSLAETEEDRRISQTKKLLSELQEEYENILNARLDNVDALIQAVIDGVDANASIIVDTINTAAQDVGYVLTDGASTIFESATVKDLASYFTNGGFVEKVTSIAEAVKNIDTYYNNATKNANTQQTKQTATTTSQISATDKALTAAAQTGTKNRNASNKTSGVDGNWTTNANGTRGWMFNDGEIVKGWSKIDGKMHYFNNKGEELLGYKKIDGKMYYLTKDKGRLTNSWSPSGNAYFGEDGSGVVGLRTLYRNGKKGTFYFNSDGVMQTGLQVINGKKYYFKKDTGKVYGDWGTKNGKLYYFDKTTGEAITGWYKDSGGRWRFFDKKTNEMLKAKWLHNGAVTTNPKKGDFYINNQGIMVADGKRATTKGYLTFDKDGKWKGYKSGTRSVGSSGLYWTNEGMPETIVRKSDGALLTRLNSGDTVFNGNATQNMWDFANNPEKFLRSLGVSNNIGSGNNVSLEFNLSGLRSPEEFMNALRKNKRFEKLIQEMTLGRAVGHGSLAKNAITI